MATDGREIFSPVATRAAIRPKRSDDGYERPDIDIILQHVVGMIRRAIEFLGCMPQAITTSPDYFCGTIAFFGLDDVDMRSDLFLERAMIIVSMKPLLDDANDQNTTAADRVAAQARVDRFTSPKSPHANCARSFERLYKADRAAAMECYRAADAYWASKS